MTETEDYSKAATPTPHAASHEKDGGDEISVSGLSGQLADSQYSSFLQVAGLLARFQFLIAGNWTIRTSAYNNSWLSVCWSPELRLFVAVSSSGDATRVMTSPDGINWTIRTSAADNDWRSVCWSPELKL
ncbi:MAG: hypothetical protein E3J94_02780, partial [Desulfobacteraceae bacterium]